MRGALVAFGLVAACGLSTVAEGASIYSSYDMGVFLNEPHPFAAGAGTPPPLPPGAAPPAAAPVPAEFPPPPAPAAPPAGDDLDDLGPGEPAVAVAEVSDPLEPMNRMIFDFNEILQDLLLRPMSFLYNEYVPVDVRDVVHNFLQNLKSPTVLANDLMQGEGRRALVTVGRAAVNTTAGLGGLFDVAKHVDLEAHDEDFGQTLAVWGVGEGFYLVLPVLGPSNPRDAVGRLVVDSFLDPLALWLENTGREDFAAGRLGLTIVDEYALVADDLNDIKQTSIDYYAALRSLYRQKRKSDIKNGRDEDVFDLEYEVD